LLQAPASATLVGVDQDAAALALGYRLSEAAGIEVTLARASAYGLPFRDATFDIVMTRVALNYMHQKTALAEMIRVLRPGGQLFCRVEGPLHDLKGLADVRSVRGLLCRSRDFGYGVIHALLGWQPIPGSLLTGGRAFSTAARLSRILSELGCGVVAKVATGPVAMGGHTQVAILARLARRDSSSLPPTLEPPAE
jgi:SAM-dependent methyltransferase